mgnify:CR=1 FL=1
MSKYTTAPYDDEHIRPLAIRYLVMPPFNADGTIDGTNPEGWEASANFSELMQKTIDEVEQHGGESYIVTYNERGA